jgi:phosphotransferase system enzyme I (PtsP)
MIQTRRIPRRARESTRPRVHARGEARLDAMLALTEEASRSASLPDVLRALCEKIAHVLSVDVCSIYLRESPRELFDDRQRGELVLRATHGYPQSILGSVRMRVGEGLTGFAVECLRPVSVARAAVDARNKAFEGMDEERFPSLCALPLVDGGRAVGALVIQRRLPRAFGQREIVLAASVAAPVLFAIERARSRAREALEHERAQAAAHPSTRPHEVVLRGQVAAPGEALGTVVLRRHVPAKPVEFERRHHGDPDDERARLGRALAEAAEEIAALESWALEQRTVPGSGSTDGALALDRAQILSLLSPSRFVLEDARLRGRMIKHVQRGAAAEEAVEHVMREYTRLLSSSGDPVLAERALEVEALCLRVMARLHAPRPKLPAGAILCAARLTVCDVLELGAAHGAAVALSSTTTDSPGIALARALALPVVVGLPDLFRWVADGDRALVDATAGSVVINPSRVDISAFRRR